MVLRLRLLTLRMLERLKHQREAGADDGGGQAQAAGGAAERRLTAAGAAAMTSPEPYVPMQELINAYAKCFFHALSCQMCGFSLVKDLLAAECSDIIEMRFMKVGPGQGVGGWLQIFLSSVNG